MNMSARPETPDIIDALTQLDKRITEMNQQVAAVQAKVDQALDTEEKIREKLDKILTTGSQPDFIEALSEVNNHLTQMNQRLDMAHAILNEKLGMLGRMISDLASKIDNNEPDVQEPVGNVAQDVASTSNSLRQADRDHRSIQPVGNNTPDDKLDLPEPVGNVAQDVATASNSFQQAQAHRSQRPIQAMGNVSPGVGAASTGGEKSSTKLVGNLTQRPAAA